MVFQQALQNQTISSWAMHCCMYIRVHVAVHIVLVMDLKATSNGGK